MKRREFITLLGGAATAWPLVVRAQQREQVRQLGILTGFAERDPESQQWIAALKQGLDKFGWTAGRNLKFNIHYSDGDLSRLPGLAAELVANAPDVVVVHGSPAMSAMREATKTIPIVFVMVADPVGAGFVTSLSRPKGNITGFLNIEPTIGGKWLELLREVAPGTARAAVLNDPSNAATPAFLREIEAAAPSMRIDALVAAVRDAASIAKAIESFASKPNGGLIVLPSSVLAANREQIIALAARFRLPAVYPFRYYVAEGALLSYGVDPVDLYRRAAVYLDRILRGEQTGDLPVQAPTKFEMAINLKTAKALGIDVPATVLASADEVIE
jgi:putative tryptophan/tyrosine transport system substrate-binding protein